MANWITAFNPEIWSKVTQAYLKKSLVAGQVANMKEETWVLKAWDKVHRPYKSDFVVSDYTNNTAITATDITSTDESLTIDQSKAIRILIDPVENKQSNYDVFKEYAPRMAYRLRDNIDQAVFTNITSSAVSVDEWDFWGTAWGPIDLWTYKPKTVFGRALWELLDNQVETDKPICLVVDPIMLNDIQQDFISDGFQTADATLKNWFVWNKFLNMNTYVSHNLPSAVSLWLSAACTAWDTITLKWVTWTAAATPTSAWDFDVTTDTASQTAVLTLAFNWTGTPWVTTYIEISTANRQKYTNNAVTATDASTAVTLTAVGRMNGSETLTDTTDGFWEETIYAGVMQQGAIDLVTQMKPNVQVNKENDNLASSVIAHTLYWVKAFNEWLQRMAKVPVRANATTV
jgi:hypothetical protein